MTKPEMIPIVYTKKQAAELLQVSERTVHSLLQRGALPAVRFGGTVRIAKQDLLAFIAQAKGGGDATVV